MNAKDVILEGDCLVLVLVLELVRGCDLLEVINKAGGKLPEHLARDLQRRAVCGRNGALLSAVSLFPPLLSSSRSPPTDHSII